MTGAEGTGAIRGLVLGGSIGLWSTSLAVASGGVDCVYRDPGITRGEFARGVAAGVIDDPAQRSIPSLPGKVGFEHAHVTTCLTREHIFTHRDDEGLLLTVFEPAQLYDFLVDAANSVLAEHGDEFDFVGFWTNFDPGILFGTAFYLPIANDVTGIGIPGSLGDGEETFDLHDDYGLAGHRLQGMLNLWNINSSYWRPGTGDGATMTRLTLGHEFEHRFGIFLPSLTDGRQLQGDNLGCGMAYHWNTRIDGQASAIQLREWVGALGPVLLDEDVLNGDTGGLFGYLDLYLMGYVSAEEMDRGHSELRYMVQSCTSPYPGPITHFSSEDVLDVAGPRVPDSTKAQKHFRTAWIMIYQPGAPPTAGELDKAVGILTQHGVDWASSTLDRGSMSMALFTDCNCNGVADDAELALGEAIDADQDGILDECQAPKLCPADLDGDGMVATVDLLTLLINWGPCVPCPSDLNGDGEVDVADLVTLLSAWGPCG